MSKSIHIQLVLRELSSCKNLMALRSKRLIQLAICFDSELLLAAGLFQENPKMCGLCGSTLELIL